MCNYQDNATSDARETVENFADEILEQLLDKGEASDDLNNDYPNGDAWHHENHVDHYYSLTDASALIDQLSEHEETDTGLWDGQDVRTAVATCAAYTFGNAVYSEWCDLIKEINEEAEIIIEDYDDDKANLEEEIDDLTNQAEEAETDAAEAAEDQCEVEAARLREQAEDLRRQIEIKQEGLDALKSKKTQSLRKLIDQIANPD